MRKPAGGYRQNGKNVKWNYVLHCNDAKLIFEGGMELSLIKALVVSMAISAVWYGMEWMQYQELQWDRKCDNVVWALYLAVLWWLFAHQN